MKTIEKIIAIGILLFAIFYNFWLYRSEPLAKIDPNDNPFQYALVDRTNQMWDFAVTECPKNPTFPICFTGYLIDHIVPNWAQGYSLPYYYSHAPQIAIVSTYRLLSLVAPSLTLFTYYHWVIYLLLCIFPLTIFASLRIIKLPWLIASVGALLASQVSTDGLYGLDPSSFLWRGYGLSSQLFAMIWMPLAIAYGLVFFQSLSFKWSTKKLFNIRTLLSHSFALMRQRSFILSVVFLTLSIMGHLGLGLLTLLSFGMIAISPGLLALMNKYQRENIGSIFVDQLHKLALVGGSAVFLLSYWIVPTLMHDKYHNISFWDPVWKFNSYGWKEVVLQLMNGHIFDFGRFPLLTILIIIAIFTALYATLARKNDFRDSNAEPSQQLSLYPLSFLFIIWFVMYFGRTTFGGLIDIIPGMKEFHQSRFIVGVHLAGFFLIPIGFQWILEHCLIIIQRVKGMIQTSAQLVLEDEDPNEEKKAHIKKTSTNTSHVVITICTVLLAIGAFIVVNTQTYSYAAHNEFLIKRGNDNFDAQNPDVETLFTALKQLPPGRVFAGRGGAWGKELQIAETTYFMHLSTYGVPVILWLPETWSPNSDVEQFFIDDWSEHYDLINVKYVVTPKNIEAKPFWEKIQETPSWTLYSVPTTGYFTTGSLAATVYSEKEHYINVVRLWMQSDYVKNKIVPQLTFSKSEMMNSPLPAFGMVDEGTYQTRDGKEFSLFEANPSYEAPAAPITILTPEKNTADMIYETRVKTDAVCDKCLVILKNSFHPNWKAYVNGKKTQAITVFPFHIGVQIPPGTEATVLLKYEPYPLKLFLFIVAPVAFIILMIFAYRGTKSVA